MKQILSIAEFAKLIGVHIKTLQRWDREGTLKAFRTKTNRRYYNYEQLSEYKGILAKEQSKNIIYCRVSSKNQIDDLKSQKEFINDFCRNKGIEIDEVFEDIASGLNFKRKKFNELFQMVENGLVKNIVIAHKDRLVRFGFDWFNGFCDRHNCKILVINDERLSPEKEIVQDLISIIHVFSCKIYGLRKYKDAISKENKN